MDPFLGSGSALVAAEKTGRVCRGVELDPLYVGVILRRFEAATGKPAVLARHFDRDALLRDWFGPLPIAVLTKA